MGEESVDLGLNLECGASAPLSKAAASRRTPQLRIGVISDTHSLMRPEALAALRGVDQILHAGDIGETRVLRELERIAPITFVRGNNDDGEGADIVVFGHSHLPHNEVIDGVRYFNPASAGPRRFNDPVAVGMIDDERAYHVALDERSASALDKRMNQLSRV